VHTCASFLQTVTFTAHSNRIFITMNTAFEGKCYVEDKFKDERFQDPLLVTLSKVSVTTFSI
jgi:hypothetical protein